MAKETKIGDENKKVEKPLAIAHNFERPKFGNCHGVINNAGV